MEAPGGDDAIANVTPPGRGVQVVVTGVVEGWTDGNAKAASGVSTAITFGVALFLFISTITGPAMAVIAIPQRANKPVITATQTALFGFFSSMDLILHRSIGSQFS